MSNFALRLPYLIYLSIGSMLFGVLVAPAFRDMPPADTVMSDEAAMQDHVHGSIEVPRVGAPQVDMQIEKDPMGGWNIRLSTENFTFAPDLVNQENVPNTGHAHLYVDGQKAARLYGPYHHLTELAPGQREIVVTLSSNDHSFYVVDGVRVEARAIVHQGDLPISDS